MIASWAPADYLAAFLGGVLVSLTPCIYPLIPVSAGYIAARASGSKVKGLFLSLTYVGGLASTYALLGLLASLTGTIFGRISSSPLAYFFAAGVIILFGLSMLGVLKVPLPNILQQPVFKGKGYFSVLLLGLTSGLLVSPCLTPVVGSILAYLVTKKNLFYGATLLFVFAYGMGLFLILISTFSSILLALPKSGRWMVYAQRLGGGVLISTGLYFIILGIRRV